MGFGSARRTATGARASAKAGEGLTRLGAHVNTSQVFKLMWERLLSREDREKLSPKIDSLTAVTAWQRVRGGSRQRAVLDIALGVNLITQSDYSWLLGEIGELQTAESKPAFKALPHWDRSTGKLFYRNRLCRRYRVQSTRTQLQMVLDAFEAAGWQTRSRIPFREAPPTISTKRSVGSTRILSTSASMPDEGLFKKQASADAARFPVTHYEVEAEGTSVKPAAIVLDNIDPTFEADKPHYDRLTVLDAAGKELWSHAGFNNAQTVGGVHGVVFDRRRQPILIREDVAKRITALNFAGKKLWQDGIDVGAIAVDEQTGYVWATCGPSLNQGETIVFDQNGKQLIAFLHLNWNGKANNCHGD